MRLAVATTVAVVLSGAQTIAHGTDGLKNVLMITVDDLRPQLNHAYGMTQTMTPNLDKFSQGATVFHRAYCQMAVCSPSRNSFMSGRRPDTTKVWNFINHFREEGVGANWTALPEYFKKHGYLTYAAGKQYHPEHPPNDDYPTSWTVDESNTYYWGNQPPIGDSDPCQASAYVTIAPKSGAYSSTAACYRNNDTLAMDDNDDRDAPQAKQHVEYDHRLATRAIEWLERVASLKKNFFIGVGFRKPHLDWRVPHQFYDQYNNATIDTAKVQTIGQDVPVLAFEMNGRMGQVYKKDGQTWQESPKGPPLPTDLQQALRHGYYAAVSFLDHEAGRVLDKLDDLGLTDSTVVMFHADHGWKLGEHGDWSKCSNWELDARVPFIIRAPFIPASVGQSTMAFAELIDMYPTLVELSGLPPVPESEGIEGTSLAPVLRNPTALAPHNKTMAFSQYPRCPQYNMVNQSTQWECLMIPKQNITRMGFSVRTETSRYTEWRVWLPTCHADWSDDGLMEQELYDHTGDMGRDPATFDDYEYVNLAKDPSSQPMVKQLAAVLKNQFQNDGASC